jgi:hypothetical protein
MFIKTSSPYENKSNVAKYEESSRKLFDDKTFSGYWLGKM